MTADMGFHQAAPEAVFAREVQKMRDERVKPLEQLTLEPFERGESLILSIIFIDMADAAVLCRPLYRDRKICSLHDLMAVRKMCSLFFSPRAVLITADGLK